MQRVSPTFYSYSLHLAFSWLLVYQFSWLGKTTTIVGKKKKNSKFHNIKHY